MTSKDKIHEAFIAISDDLNKTRAEFARQARNMDGLLNALESFTTGISSQGSMPTQELQTAAWGTSQLDTSEYTDDLPRVVRAMSEIPIPPALTPEQVDRMINPPVIGVRDAAPLTPEQVDRMINPRLYDDEEQSA